MQSSNETHIHSVSGLGSEAELHLHDEVRPPTSPSRAVVIGADSTAGALVLSASPEHWGTQIEVHPVSDASAKIHVWVLPREGNGQTLYAAIFPRLPMGDYAILESDGSIREIVTIPPNEVTFATWS